MLTFNRIVGLILISLLSSCAVQKSWVATGGSRADGVVSLAYEFGAFESPQVNEGQAISEATQRCAVWGYTGATAFGGALQTCSRTDGFGGCSTTRVTKDYQCTGGEN